MIRDEARRAHPHDAADATINGGVGVTQRGVRDAAALRAMTLKEFKYE